MDPNLWDIEYKRVSDIYNSGNLRTSSDITNLQNDLSGIKNIINAGINNYNTEFARQSDTYTIVQNEINRLQNKKASVDNAYDSTRRMVELNNNYQKRYQDYTKIIIVWVGVLALYFILNLLTQYVPAIPSILVDILVLSALIAAAVYSFIIYNNLRNYDLMNYGQINPDAPVIDADQAKKTLVDLSNANTLSSYSITNDPNELRCLKNNLFYYTDASGTKCYKTCSSPDGTNFGKCTSGGASLVTLESFQNIKANDEYEFNDYTKI
jgi:hypothetical protein